MRTQRILGVFLVIAIIISSVIVLSSCSSKNAIVGTWQDPLGQTMQFFDEGTVVTSGLLGGTGVYSFPDSTHIKIEYQGLSSLMGPQVFEFAIRDNTLILTRSGTSIELKKS